MRLSRADETWTDRPYLAGLLALGSRRGRYTGSAASIDARTFDLQPGLRRIGDSIQVKLGGEYH